MNAKRFDRIALIVHPRRELGRALATLREWAGSQGAELVQLPSPGTIQEVAPPGEAEGADLVVALGGDGTTLAALRAAAPVHLPVLGVACGSLGALTAVTADQLDDALHRVAAGDWTEKRLPAIVIEREGAEDMRAINDLVLVRGGAGQVMVEIESTGSATSGSPATGSSPPRRWARPPTRWRRAGRCSRPAPSAWCSRRCRRTAASARRW